MPPNEPNDILIYQASDGKTRLEVQLDRETVWLNLNQMTELFQRDKSVVSRHLNAIFKSDELVREATVAKNATVQIEGGREVQRVIEYFNLYRRGEACLARFSGADGDRQGDACVAPTGTRTETTVNRSDGGIIQVRRRQTHQPPPHHPRPTGVATQLLRTVIRDESELHAIRQYIIDNPVKWNEDENHPTRLLS